MMLLAPDSRGATWDWFGSGSFGADVVFMGAALAQARFVCVSKPKVYAHVDARIQFPVLQNRYRLCCRFAVRSPLQCQDACRVCAQSMQCNVHLLWWQVRALYNIDPARLGMEGFSDGATYAVSIGASPCACCQRCSLIGVIVIMAGVQSIAERSLMLLRGA